MSTYCDECGAFCDCADEDYRPRWRDPRDEFFTEPPPGWGPFAWALRRGTRDNYRRLLETPVVIRWDE